MTDVTPLRRSCSLDSDNCPVLPQHFVTLLRSHIAFATSNYCVPRQHG